MEPVTRSKPKGLYDYYMLLDDDRKLVEKLGLEELARDKHGKLRLGGQSQESVEAPEAGSHLAAIGSRGVGSLFRRHLSRQPVRPGVAATKLTSPARAEGHPHDIVVLKDYRSIDCVA